MQDQVQLPQDGAEDREAAENGGRNEGVAADADVECAFVTSSQFHVLL